MKYLKCLIIIVLNIVTSQITCQTAKHFDLEIDDTLVDTTVEIVTIETTTQLVIIITDIPQSDVDAAMNLDVGEYTTQVFDYDNFWLYDVTENTTCFYEYMRCIMTQGLQMPVCSVNDPFEIPYGYVTYDSVCMVYLDNCRRKRHFWRILDVGKCIHYSSQHGSLEPTKRNFGGERSWTFIFYVLGTEDLHPKFKHLFNPYLKVSEDYLID